MEMDMKVYSLKGITDRINLFANENRCLLDVETTSQGLIVRCESAWERRVKQFLKEIVPVGVNAEVIPIEHPAVTRAREEMKVVIKNVSIVLGGFK